MRPLRSLILLTALAIVLISGDHLATQSTEVHASLLQDPTPTEPTTVVAVAPTLVLMSVDSSTDLRVEIEDPTDLYGFDMTLAFEASVVQIVDEDPDMPGVQVQLGSLFDGHQYWVATNRVDNEVGTIRFAVSLLGAEEEPITTDGDLITMTVSGVSNGASPLALTDIMLADPSANFETPDTRDATIIVGTGVTATPTSTATSVPPSPTPSPSGTATQPPATPTSTSTAAATPSPTSTSTAATSSPPSATPTGTSSPPSVSPTVTPHSPTPTPNQSPTMTTTRTPATPTRHVYLSVVLNNYQQSPASTR